jgi:alpha-1,3-glucan synthase
MAMSTWPAYVQLNVWSFDDYYYGDTGGDGVLDRLPPNTNAPNYLNMSAPPHPRLAWTLFVDDATMTCGQSSVGSIMYALLFSIPLIIGTLAVVVFMWSFYGTKHNQFSAKAQQILHDPFEQIHDRLEGADLTVRAIPSSRICGLFVQRRI